MNFFAQQHKARKKTFILVVYFVLAIVLIVAAVNAAVYFIFYYAADQQQTPEQWLVQPYWIWISIATMAVIGLGSLKDIIRLGGGGKAVAEMVGARPINSNTKDPAEQRLVNIVEEMSIASGTPRPVLYVMGQESAINAFVAGYRPTEAVLVVTKGALETLNRDELQGVIGHEYSHVLNGDMRINIKLWGIVSGILLIGQLGYFLLRSLRYSGRGGGKGKGQGMAAIFLFGLALFVIGYIGLFFGRLIKAAVSRQRELLADASSVQFTRNPDGLAGALWKIKQHSEGSMLDNKHAEDMSHMCFGPSLMFNFQNLFATHPPLDERIRIINPGYVSRKKSGKIQMRIEAGEQAKSAAVPSGAMGFATATQAAIVADAAQIAASVGNPAPRHMDYAASLYTAIPPALLESLHQIDSAKHVIYALLLASTSPEKRDAACAIIKAQESEQAVTAARNHVQAITQLGARGRLPILNLAIPSLKSLAGNERTRFLNCVEMVINADQRFTLFEFTLLTLLRDHLSESAQKSDKTKYFKFDDVIEELRLLFTVLARAGVASAEQAQQTFRRVMVTFGKAIPEPAPASACTMNGISVALAKLEALAPMLKQSVITACADCVLHDGKVMPVEAELLQAIAACLDCPMPPLIS